jgi:putative transposase
MEVYRFRIIYNSIRPHEALGDRTPSTASTGCDQQKTAR